MESNEIILGIDPGFGRLGVAIVNDKSLLTYCDCFQTDKSKLFEYRLYDIFKYLTPLFKLVTTLGYEKPVITGSNGAYLNQVVGVLNILAVENELKIITYSPSQIKSIVTGNYKANKKDIEKVVIARYNIKENLLDDAYDAAAVCLTWNIINKHI